MIIIRLYTSILGKTAVMSLFVNGSATIWLCFYKPRKYVNKTEKKQTYGVYLKENPCCQISYIFTNKEIMLTM